MKTSLGLIGLALFGLGAAGAGRAEGPAGAPRQGKIETRHVAVMGQSCGAVLGAKCALCTNSNSDVQSKHLNQ